MLRPLGIAAIFILFLSCVAPMEYDIIIRNGTIYDGSGERPYTGDVAIVEDTIVSLGDLGRATGKVELDVTGLWIGRIKQVFGRRER